ncbi:MAG: hypothetical protein ACYTFI_04160 [Planctomycetota bacterium]|jgi:hypothetical protein
MKAKAILCAAVVYSLVAAGCSKSEKKPGGDKPAKPPTGGGGPSEARAVAWGEAVKGLQAGLAVKEVARGPNPRAVLSLHVRNRGQRPVRILSLPARRFYWALGPDPLEVTVDGRRPRYLISIETDIPLPERTDFIDLAPGETSSTDLQFLPHQWGMDGRSPIKLPFEAEVVFVFEWGNGEWECRPDDPAAKSPVRITGLWIGNARSGAARVAFGRGPSRSAAVAWGEAVNGLQIGITRRDGPRPVALDGKARLGLHVRNVGAKTFRFPELTVLSRMAYKLPEATVGGKVRSPRVQAKPAPMTVDQYVDLAPGEADSAGYVFSPYTEGLDAGERAAVAFVVRSSYFSRARDPVRKEYRKIEAVWQGKARSGTVEIEIAPVSALGPVSHEERARLVKGAEAACKLAKAPTAGRRATVVGDGKEATVTFHLPEGMLGGDFVIKIDRTTGDVIDVKLWR